MNVLITSASRKVALVRAFRSALAAEGGGRVLAADASPLAPALYAADEAFLLRPSSDTAFVDEVLDLCRSAGVRLVVPTRDGELPVFAEARSRFAAEGIMVLVAPPDVVATCQDKRQFVAFCLRHDLPVPATYEPETVPSGLSRALHVRPARGKGAAGMRVTSEAELAYALSAIPNAIIQEQVEAPEFTVDLFVHPDGRIVSVVPRERVLVFGGESFISRTVRSAVLTKQAIALASALGLVGHNTIQCFLRAGDDVRFIETNPRYGGAANLGIAAGADTPRFAVRTALGREVPSAVGEFRENYVMLRYTEDFFLDEAALLTKLSASS